MSMPEHDVTHHLLDPLGPTSHGRGSNAKIDLMADRYERGVLIWHPDDSQEMSPEVAENMPVDTKDVGISILWTDHQPPVAKRRPANILPIEEESYEDDE